MSFSEILNNKEVLMLHDHRHFKTRTLQVLSFAFFAFIFYGCNDNNVSLNNEENTGINTESEWLVPEHQVINGGPGKDGIPSIDDPKFETVDQITFIPAERRVLGIIRGGEVFAYPHQILDWHEIVNDGNSITITYCPLTATGIAWSPQVGPDFGTSGLIFRNNLVAYDRNTESLWSQMRLRSINGEHLGKSIEPLNILDTTWDTWKKMYPKSQVLTTETGFNRDYNSYAYGKDYSENDGLLIFPTLNRTDNRLNVKARVHGVFTEDDLDEESTVRVYEISEFKDGIEVIHDELNGERFVVIGSSTFDFAIAYKSTMRDSTQLTFEAVQGNLTVVMKDEEGNLWNVFGEAVEGPRNGQRLIPAKSYSGYWFAFRDMFTLPEIYDFNEE